MDEFVSLHCPDAPYYAFTTTFLSTPILSTYVSITLTALRNSGGLRTNPTPLGVPVGIISPGSNVMPLERVAIIVRIGKIIMLVFASCLVMPLTRNLTISCCGSLISSAVTIHGPIGQYPSMLFPLKNCLWRDWRSRAETSLSTV